MDKNSAALRALSKDRRRIAVKATQDFVQNRMYYGVQSAAAWYLVSSERRLRTRPQCQRAGLEIIATYRPASHFSWPGVRDYLKGKTVLAPEIFQRVRDYLRPRVDLQPEAYSHLLALWAMGTYVHRVFRIFPYLWVGEHSSPKPSPLLPVLQPLVFNGYLSSRLDQRTLYRLTDSAATLLLDGVSWARQHRGCRAMLRAGFHNGPVVARAERGPGGFPIRHYSVYSPKVLVGDTAAWEHFGDRAIPFSGARPVPANACEVADSGPALRLLTDDLHIFGLQYAEAIAHWYRQPAPPFGLEGAINRERDLWQPLFVLANLIDRELGSNDVVEELAELR